MLQTYFKKQNLILHQKNIYNTLFIFFLQRPLNTKWKQKLNNGVKNQISFYKLELHIWKTLLLRNDLSSLHQVRTQSPATADLLTPSALVPSHTMADNSCSR